MLSVTYAPHSGKKEHNCLPNDNILAPAELKAFADHKFNVAKMPISLFDRVENIGGKGENTVTGIFSFFHIF